MKEVARERATASRAEVWLSLAAYPKMQRNSGRDCASAKAKDLTFPFLNILSGLRGISMVSPSSEMLF